MELGAVWLSHAQGYVGAAVTPWCALMHPEPLLSPATWALVPLPRVTTALGQNPARFTGEGGKPLTGRAGKHQAMQQPIPAHGFSLCSLAAASGL